MKERIFNSISLIDCVSDETKQYINSVIERLYQLGKLDDIDLGALNLLCANYETTLRIYRKLLTGEAEYVTENNAKNGLTSILNQAQNTCIRIMQDFGLTAKSRKSLTNADTKTAQTNCVIDEFLDN